MANLTITEVKDSYLGEKKAQIRNGFGIYYYGNKYFRYEGEWKNGKKEGHGLFVMGDGSYYEGEFKNGEIDGHGTRFFALTGNTYRGTFHLGEIEGQGLMTYADGSTFEGEWSDNKREGYGVLREANGSVYQGYFHNNRRHGEGTYINSKGDRYDGDWINDKRQGHGELKNIDGTIYDGQWMNDLCNGQGSVTHASGMTYNGLWINGLPAIMASKMVIVGDTVQEIEQDSRFKITIKCLTENDQLVLETGRELRITAGFRYVPNKSNIQTSENVNITENEIKDKKSGTLFNMIEEVEEELVQTPFGYSIVNYPLTNQIQWPPEIFSRNSTVLSEKPDKPDTSRTTDSVEIQSHAVGESSVTSNEQPSVQASSPLSEAESVQDCILTPAPVANKKTVDGSVTFDQLILPSPPPVSRPFMEDEKMKEKLLKHNASKSKLNKKDLEANNQALSQKSALQEQTSSTAGKHTAEYVIMVSDVTSPPFLDIRLPPAFAIIRVVAKSSSGKVLKTVETHARRGKKMK